MFDGLIKQAVDEIFGRLSSMQSVKHLFMVDGFTLLRMGAIGERARTGEPLSEPYGATRRFPDFNELMFLPAQLSRFPLDDYRDVETEVTIGEHCARPLKLSTPITISGMAFGIALSLEAKLALARASSLAGTVQNSGESGFLPAEREASDKYVVQWNRGGWGNNLADLAEADGIEILVGQGAEASLGYHIAAADMRDDLRNHFGLSPGEDAVRPARFTDISDRSDFKRLVAQLREASGGAPVGMKFAAARIEEDCEVAIEAGVDFITIDGAQGGGGAGREVTINNTGIPLIYAIPRAHKHLQDRGVREKVSLLVGGGLRDAGDCLKAMALGADAVCLGESCLLALVFHQMNKMPPFTNPAEMFLYNGQYRDQLDVEEGAVSVANFLTASTVEMQLLAQALGKDSLRRVDTSDMVALSKAIAELTKVPAAHASGEVPSEMSARHNGVGLRA